MSFPFLRNGKAFFPRGLDKTPLCRKIFNAVYSQPSEATLNRDQSEATNESSDCPRHPQAAQARKAG